MKALIMIMLPLLAIGQFKGPAQHERGTDSVPYKIPIYATSNKNVSLFFPSPIKQGIVGADNFVFSFNQNEAQTLGLLKAFKGEETNLLVVTMNGDIYSFIVRYAQEIDQLAYFIESGAAIGNEKGRHRTTAHNGYQEEGHSISQKGIGDGPTQLNPQDPAILQQYETVHYNRTPRDTSYLLYNKDRKEYIRKFCSNLIAINMKKSGRQDLAQIEEGVGLKLIDLVYNYNEMYFLIEVDNRNGVDYDLNFLNVSVANHRRKKSKSAQTVYKKPLMTYQLLSRVPRKSKRRIIYVFPKFSINKEKKVIIELNEWGGERNVTLDIGKNYINNPKSI